MGSPVFSPLGWGNPRPKWGLNAPVHTRSPEGHEESPPWLIIRKRSAVSFQQSARPLKADC